MIVLHSHKKKLEQAKTVPLMEDMVMYCSFLVGGFPICVLFLDSVVQFGYGRMHLYFLNIRESEFVNLSRSPGIDSPSLAE